VTEERYSYSPAFRANVYNAWSPTSTNVLHSNGIAIQNKGKCRPLLEDIKGVRPEITAEQN